ncbi:AraC family transcriptional regulator [Capsulimonas corticalis]|uniref:AraC family transcriptional regulator n=1 Tax=Capsulimonas corticalis TaxID=2219043 RepID=A0A402CZ71_9BACT|nr:AraC family transcriptional regulator [Capsulimonas corticalis]
MQWLDRMMDALEYLEAHLDDECDVGEAARAACSSTFHFQRMFHMLTGVTVAEYVRKRRLSLAAQELASSRVKVIDVAMKYGYDTPEAFCKAFRRAHGLTPSDARRSGARLKVFPRMSFQISLKGDQDMDYRMVEKPGFQVMGKAQRVSTRDGENMKAIPEFWSRTMQEGDVKRLAELTSAGGVVGDAILGVCTEFQYDQQEFTYLIAVEAGAAPPPDGCVVKEIPAATWAVFESVGAMPDAIQKVWGRIFSEFFPSTGFEHAEGGPELEVYPPGDVSSDDYRCEVWVPVVKKS